MNEKTARADKSTDPIMPMSGTGVHLVLIIDGNQHAVSLKDIDCAAIASRARHHEAVMGIRAAGMPDPAPSRIGHVHVGWTTPASDEKHGENQVKSCRRTRDAHGISGLTRMVGVYFGDSSDPDSDALCLTGNSPNSQRHAERIAELWNEAGAEIATLRTKLEEADRRLAEMTASFTMMREARATHRCKVCSALWVQHPGGSWSLCSDACGKCCDMAAMGDQIEPIGLAARVAQLERVRDEVCEHRDQLRQQVEQLRAELTLGQVGKAGDIPAEVANELARALVKFPTWPTDALHAVAVLGEEFGELTKAVLQGVYEPHKNPPDAVRKEAVQVAAMALRFLASVGAYTTPPCHQHLQDAVTRAAGAEVSNG